MVKAGLIHGATVTDKVRNSRPADLAQWQMELEAHLANHRERPTYAQTAIDRLADIADALSNWYAETRRG